MVSRDKCDCKLQYDPCKFEIELFTQVSYIFLRAWNLFTSDFKSNASQLVEFVDSRQAST